MNIYRKSLIIQSLLFIVFFIMGLNLFITPFLPENSRWVGYVLLGVLVLFAVFGFYIYKRPDQSICTITPKEISMIRYLLYGYFFVYIAHMLLSSRTWIEKDMLDYGAGVILMGVAVYGLWMQYKIIKVK